MTLVLIAAIPQLDGGMRYLLGSPSDAKNASCMLRRDPAQIDYVPHTTIVDQEKDGRRFAHEWEGRREGLAPDWRRIRAAIVS